MNVVELQHPEDLLDKLEAGALSPAERARLDAHLGGCAACRMELAMRSDFAAEPPLAFPELPQLTLAAPEPKRAVVSVAPRRGRRRQFSLLVIAAAWCASSALAATAAVSTVKGPWAAWFAPKNGALGAPSAKPTPRHARSAKSAAERASATPVEVTSAGDAPSDAAMASSSASALSAASAEAPLGSVEGGKIATTTLATRTPAVVTTTHDDASADTASVTLSTAAFPALGDDSTSSAAAALLAEADHARRAGDGTHAIALYRELEQSYPSSPESALSVALVAKMLLDRGDAAGAAAAYERYLRDGSGALRSEALVGRARALEALGRTGEALAAWQEVERRLPGTVHARLAAERLAALSDR